MDIVILFSKKEDYTQCTGYLYRKGESYEIGRYRNAYYIIVKNASAEIENEFAQEEIFMEYYGQEKIGMFPKNSTGRASSFLSNCETVDLPMVEDVYEMYHKQYKDHHKKEKQTLNADVFVFGCLDQETEQKIQMLESGLVDKVKKDWKLEQEYLANSLLRASLTPFHLGWNTKYICIWADCPKDTADAEARLVGLGHFCRNQNYKHDPIIQIDLESTKADPDIIAEVAEKAHQLTGTLVTTRL